MAAGMDKPALVFGASGEQGRAVLSGLVDAGYSPVYGFSRDTGVNDTYLTDALGCILLPGSLGNPQDVMKALKSTKAQAIFLVTTTELLDEHNPRFTASYNNAMEEEYETIVKFFHVLKEVHEEDKLPRTIVMSTQDNVQELCQEEFRRTGEDWILPLDDGSIVPHFSAKGKGGEEAVRLLNDIPGLHVILLTVPFFYSNFLAFFTPLPNKSQTEWEMSACFGDGSTPIDMMNAADLGRIVPYLLEHGENFRGQNLRICAERISMDAIAKEFSELFGKDVVYNPLLPKELAALPFPGAPAMAQMCQYLGDNSRYVPHDAQLTKDLLLAGSGRPPQVFRDWLLVHSDSTAFSRVGLNLDAPEITSVTVFGATSAQGKSVIQGLLNDTRKQYMIRATTRRSRDDPAIQEVQKLDPERVSVVHADFDELESCRDAVSNMDGAFLAAEFFEETLDPESLEREERHVRNIIDACEGRVKHLVFACMTSAQTIAQDTPEEEMKRMSPKARLAAYARSKELSVTIVLMPCYSEIFFDMIKKVSIENEEKVVLQVPIKHGKEKVMCMSVSELGTAVANIFDSYECYAGHEIGLVTDFVTIDDVQKILQDVFDESISIESRDAKEWIEARDTYMRDMGQLFANLSHVDAVKHRHSVATTYKLVPSALNLRRWVQHNKDNPDFREKLGLR